MRVPTSTTEFDAGTRGNVVISAFSFNNRHGRWRAVEPCGSGGTAEVWRVAAPDGREAAMKRLQPALRHRADQRAALRRELELLEAVASPALVHPIELVEDDDGPALVLEYLPNGDLVSLIGAPPRHWMPALRTVLTALDDLHAHGVAHGDLKARNVLFARDHGARLVDLMSARAVDAPAVRSTKAYGLPPASAASARAGDCFAFAVLLHELATGRLPYGTGGPSRLDDIDGSPAPRDPVAARVAAAARPMLAAGGGLPEGLSYFADVIESVGAAGA